MEPLLPKVQLPRKSSVSIEYTPTPASFLRTASSTYTDTVRFQVQQKVNVFLKNTAVGDVMFRELDNFKKSYN